MNVLGKIFVFAVFIMSLVFMTFAVAIFTSRTNWEREVNRKPEEVRAGEKPGYKFQILAVEEEREKLKTEIDRLKTEIAKEEAARDQVIAKLQSALGEKDSELGKLREEKDSREKAQQAAIAKLEAAEESLKKAVTQVEELQEKVTKQQVAVDEQVSKAAVIAQQLHAKEAELEIAKERKAQLEKQVASARILLAQSGLTIDSLPKDRVPNLEGAVIAVADGAIEVSVGGDEGLPEGHTLEVYRDGEYLGRARVRTVMPDRAIAVLLKEYARGVVQRGDKVKTRLKS
jgi:superfamily II DNA helicase RecQ